MTTQEQHGSTFLAHEQVKLLLPWFVNGSLANAERGLVQQHLDACSNCRRELAGQQRLQIAIRNSGPVTGGADKAFARLARSLPTPTGRRTGPTSVLGDLWRAWTEPAWVRYALPAMGLAALALLLPGVNEPKTGGSEHLYRTLAARKLDDTLRNTDISVAFRSGISPARVQEIVTATGARVVAGPDAAGVYTVRMGSAGELSTVLHQLQQNTVVSFAVPAVAKRTEGASTP